MDSVRIIAHTGYKKRPKTVSKNNARGKFIKILQNLQKSAFPHGYNEEKTKGGKKDADITAFLQYR